MTSTSTQNPRVLSGMRPTGRLHLGHYHGVLKNWVELQHQYECFFFVADWHALTTHYEEPGVISRNVWDLVIDWLAAGINPGAAKMFIQSRVPEHAELHLLLSMVTPLGWLERVPSYKDQQEQIKEKDLATYGFLGYPLLQSADILIYRAQHVPVGEDQVAHVELTREAARRFNHLYGREPDFEEKVERAIKSLGGRNTTVYRQLRRKFQETGDQQALERGRALQPLVADRRGEVRVLGSQVAAAGGAGVVAAVARRGRRRGARLEVPGQRRAVGVGERLADERRVRARDDVRVVEVAMPHACGEPLLVVAPEPPAVALVLHQLAPLDLGRELHNSDSLGQLQQGDRIQRGAADFPGIVPADHDV